MTYQTFEYANGYGIRRPGDGLTLCGNRKPVTWKRRDHAQQFSDYMNRISMRDLKRDLNSRLQCMRKIGENA
jgi:hypothetical protein